MHISICIILYFVYCFIMYSLFYFNFYICAIIISYPMLDLVSLSVLWQCKGILSMLIKPFEKERERAPVSPWMLTLLWPVSLYSLACSSALPVFAFFVHIVDIFLCFCLCPSSFRSSFMYSTVFSFLLPVC